MSDERDAIYTEAERVKNDAVYQDALDMMFGEAVEPYEYAIMRFETILGWRDADAKIEECYAKIREIKDRKAQEASEAQERENQEKEQQRIKADKDARQGGIITAVIAVVVIAALVWGIFSLVKLFTQTIPNNKYDKAMELISQGEYVEAYDILVDLKNFKDSKAQAEAIFVDSYKQLLRQAKIGDVVEMGKYQGKEIKWMVLDRDGDKMFLLSKYGLETKPYNESGDACTWETCSLRKWLNDEFYMDAFEDWQQDIILLSNVTADKNPYHIKVDPGNDTQDKVFLLSVVEVEKYFEDSSTRMYGTAYLSEKLGKTQKQYIEWWTRTPGYSNDLAANVGSWEYTGMQVEWEDYYGVRPAMWVDLSE